MNRWQELLASKERAVIHGDWLLAALPVNQGRAHRYLLVNKRNGEPRWIERLSVEERDREVTLLWQALQARFPGELREPAG
jgi:hypothetical protein